MAFVTEHVIEWGECDPLGIIFYPNFYRWMDNASWQMFHAAGLTLASFEERFGIIGTPLVEANCQFRLPGRPGDRLSVETTIPEWRERAFRVTHRFTCTDRLVAEGFEVRVPIRADDNPSGIAACGVPEEVRQALESVL